MGIAGVITGDIISSTTIRTEWKQIILDTIQNSAQDLKALSPLKLEFFRGDSFQIVVDNPAEALKIAVLLRAGLKSNTPNESEYQWDARMALGVGKIDYAPDKVVISDGEAFRYSGWEFDELGKKKLAIRTPWKDTNEELKVNTGFADEIISGWSIPQAQAIYWSILHWQMSQKEIAAKLNKSAQNISKLLSTGKEPLIRLYLERYTQIITKRE
ncbi:MAG: hypothetical protein PHG27_04770 [Massilibacteroides sp.]|nr:hypothetical protein [Massilibacteroides sp.]MDD3061638.1 hypothetical protein [Massilibacteroides sp.]MDD4114899.1 hypothetical protein [Massilibacteroides sp.]MDD4659978.1 hypothetical protein [Massilibacteroides sp.]